MSHDTGDPGAIGPFFGEWRSLSNFYPCDVELDGDSYRSVEHAYQAAKTTSEIERAWFRGAPSAGKAKRLSAAIEVRPGWDQMLTILWGCPKAGFALNICSARPVEASGEPGHDDI
jgi:hypothetical protein